MWRAAVCSFFLINHFVCTLLAADDPFIGRWKLNLPKSRLTGQTLEIQEVSGNSYKFKEDEHSDIVLADGLDHLTHFGDTMAITQKKPDTWAITYKRGKRVLMNTIWKVSQDGQTLTYTATGTRPNGQSFTNQTTAKRTGGSSGLTGTWETTTVKLSSPEQILIGSYESGGHLVTFPSRNQTVRMKFDGREYPDQGPTDAGRTRSGFTPAVREALMRRFHGLEISECPFANLPEARSGRWGEGSLRRR